MASFTPAQKRAISDRDKDILVSASAGSGKTTVLVQRVIEEVLSGTGVDQLLIVTFTKAAAEEMKQRIKNELNAALKKNNSKAAYLRRQLTKVDTANISTIDSFCMDVIHRFYYIIDLDPSFSVLTDETQAALLKERALKEIEAERLENNDQNFINFYNNFASDRDADAARNLLLDLYNYAMTKPDYINWLDSLSQEYDLDNQDLVKTSLWKNQIKPYISEITQNLRNKIEQLLANPVIETKELAKVKDSYTLFLKHLELFISSLTNNDDYDDQRSALKSCIFEGNYRKSKKWDEDLLEFYEQTQDLKKEVKSQIFDLYSKFYAVDEKQQIAVLQNSKGITKTIVEAEKALIARFGQLKRQENLIDYSDMEQFAYQILNSDTSNSALAREFYQNKFSEILVDEYQDINPLQERIIQTIKSKQNNLFMVGDVKQSIYGFRQAEPSLFLKKYHDFGKDSNDHERIVLADNFRSSRPVTEFVNKVFNPVMDSEFGGIDYKNEGQLVYGATYYPTGLSQASEIIYHQKDKKKEIADDDNSELDYSEIQMVIARIKQLKKEKFQVFDTKSGNLRDFKYSDIAILTRSRSDNLAIMQEFAKHDIPLFISDAQNYFQTFELTIMLAYLKIIDNPDQDIPLVTVLRSPIFNFNENELAKIRINNKNSTFFEALSSYVAKNDDLSKKIKNFLNQLDDLRKFAASHRIAELIWSIYEKTSLLEIMTALPNGEQRRINLEALYERASSYESAGFKGLYQFINFIDRMRKTQKDLAQPLLTKEAGDAVRLMTIHGSKGLEFPIVFCVGMQKRYQLRDLNENYIISNNSLGLTIKNKDYRIDSLVKSIANVNKKRQMLEEESRILYVALTRAKQKLIVISEIDNFDKKVSDWNNQIHNGTIALSDKLNASNSLSLMGPALAFDKHLPKKVNEITNSLDQKERLLYVKYDQTLTSSNNEVKKSQDDNEYGLLKKTANKLFNYQYPFSDATKTTAYQAVSEIKRAFNDPLDPDLENSHLIGSSNRYLQPIETRPKFLFKDNFTGAEIGTATHLILQYYDYTNGTNEKNLDSEIERLVQEGKLSSEIVPHIKKDQINWFVNSDFAQKFTDKPENLKREVDFSSLISAETLFKNFSDPNAKILVHGTIDGYFIDDDGIILFDYKTDHIDNRHLEEAITKIKSKYTGQLRLYEKALNEINQIKVKEKYLILLDAKKIVAVN